MTSRIFRRVAGILLLFVLTGCGSGGGAGAGLVADIGSGGTGIAAGTITGFGSIIIDGRRYSDAGAAYDITADSEDAVAVSPTLASIGQQVEAEIDSGGNATAVHIYPELIGVVSAISTNTLTVAGMRVVVNAADPALPTTVYGGYTQFSDIRVNDRVEVNGLPATDNSGPYVVATRIELEPSNCSGACPVRVTGTLGQLNTASQTFTLGALSVSYSGSTVMTPSGQALANGERVSVLSSTPLNGTSLTATAITIRALDKAVSDLRLSGEIDNYTSNASFSIAGVAVNAANATLSPASLVLAEGLNVIVRGSFDPTAKQLVAASVTQYDSHSSEAELHGTVANFVSVANFEVRGTLVDASAATFENGTAANLQNNAYVEVHGTVSNNVVSASTVAFTSEAEGSVDDLSGVVGGYTSATQPFTITLDNRDTTVQAILAATPFFIGGTSADLGNGKYVTVNASLVNGQWVVNTVTFMLGTPPAGSGDGSNASGGGSEIEGIASNVNLATSTFSLNGISVSFAGVTPTGIGLLANGVRVQVSGTLTGTNMVASQIQFDQ